MPRTKSVIISVYVETPVIRSHQRSDPIKRTNPNPFSSRPQAATPRGYDRRAQLLAYAQRLRNGSCQEWPSNNSRPKPKKWRLSTSMTRVWVSLDRMFQTTRGQWRYERIVTEDYGGDGEDGYCCPKGIKMKKKATSTRGSPRFGKRLKCLLKEFTSAWKCNGGCSMADDAN